MTARLGGPGTGALVSVGCLAQFFCGLSPIGGELEEASAVCGVAGVLGGAGAGVGAVVEDLGEWHGGPHAAGVPSQRHVRHNRDGTGAGGASGAGSAWVACCRAQSKSVLAAQA